MSLRWEGHDLQPAHRRWRFWVAEGRDGLLEARSSSQVIPFRRGRLHVPAIGDRRPLEVRGYIKEITDGSMQAELDEIKGLLDPERFAPGILVDDFADGTQRWIRGVPRDLMSRYGGQAGRLLSIDLEALDPYWYSAWGTLALDGGLFLGAGLTLDSSAEIVVAGSGDYALVNPGTAESERVRVAITGPSAGPVGVEVVGSEPVGFTYPALIAGQSLIVDNHERTVTLTPSAGPSVNGRKDLTFRPGNEHGEYVRFPPGAQTIRVTGGATTTRIRFTPTYL